MDSGYVFVDEGIYMLWYVRDGSWFLFFKKRLYGIEIRYLDLGVSVFIIEIFISFLYILYVVFILIKVLIIKEGKYNKLILRVNCLMVYFNCLVLFFFMIIVILEIISFIWY